MKFIVSRNEIYKNLNAISGVLSNNNNMPILDNFLFKIEGNNLTVTASDLDCTMSAVIELNNVEGEGSVAVPSKTLLETLKLTQEMPIVFSITQEDDKFSIKISAADGEYDGHCYNGDEFPQAKSMEESRSFDIDANVLQRGISKTIFATGTDEIRANMMGIFCELNEDNITFVATDAHKLVRFRNTCVKTQDPVSFILPKKPMAQLKNVLSAYNGLVHVDYSPETNYIRFAFENIVLYSSLKEGNYPNYKVVIPKSNDKTFIVSRDAFLQSIRRVGIYANQSTYQIRVSLTAENAAITAEDIDYSKKAEENIVGVYTGEPMTIGFNSRFLREILENIDAPEIQIDMSMPNRAALIYPAQQKEDDEENLLMLIMPVMLNN